MSRPSAFQKSWCFTLNNPELTEDGSGPLKMPPNVAACVYQLERGASGTAHLQGYVEFTDRFSMRRVKEWLPGAHWEPRKSTRQNAIRYCIKEDTRVDGPWWFPDKESFGSAGQGKRNDIKDVQDAIKEGKSKREIFEEFGNVAAKFPRYIDQLLSWRMSDSLCSMSEFLPRNNMQVEIVSLVHSPIHPRHIHWFYDLAGDTGKSYTAKYLVREHGAFFCNGGKAADIVHGYQGQPVVVFDYVRDSAEYVNYGAMEQLKNGVLFSPKYDSGMKQFNTPLVLVFANFSPDRAKFSRNRCVLYDVAADGSYNVGMVEDM